MNETVTATYGSDHTVKNVVEALVDSIGIPQEKVFVDKPSHQVKVIIPTAIVSEAKKVMQSHQPKDMTERVWGEA